MVQISPALQSNEEDEPEQRELLVHVEFDGAVKLMAVTVIGKDEASSPSKLRLFANRDNLDFDAARSITPTQQWDLQADMAGVLEYQTQAHKFQGVVSLDLHLVGSFGSDFNAISFVGFKGTFTERKRQAVEAVYEARAMPSDHKAKNELQGSYGI